MRGHGAPHLTLLRALALAVFCCSAAFVIVMLSDGSLLTRREGGAAPRRLLPPQAQAPLSATAQPDATGAGAAQGRRDGTPQQQASGNASSSELYDIGEALPAGARAERLHRTLSSSTALLTAR